jgi:hypothetical protein
VAPSSAIPQILRLVDDRESVRSAHLGPDRLRDASEHVRRRYAPERRQLLARAFEDRPQNFALLSADPRLSSKTCDVA